MKNEILAVASALSASRSRRTSTPARPRPRRAHGAGGDLGRAAAGTLTLAMGMIVAHRMTAARGQAGGGRSAILGDHRGGRATSGDRSDGPPVLAPSRPSAGAGNLAVRGVLVDTESGGVTTEADELVRNAPATWREEQEEAHRAAQRRMWCFRITMLVSVVVLLLLFRTLRTMMWGQGTVPHTALDKLISSVSIFWALPALPAAVALAGLLSYRGLPAARRGAPATDPFPSACPNEVCFRIVSRGRNADALRDTVASVRECLGELPLFPYRIEVVTDQTVALDMRHDLRHMVVPAAYRTPNQSRFKARALQYAIDMSDLADDAWIMHLDEESHVTTSLVVGIRDAVNEEERSGAHRIGQGLILYHRNLPTHPFMTLADMVRTGEDLGRFHFQHRLGFTLFGLHGSFILVRNDVERAVGFDVGPEGSITEDAFWALRQMATGKRCRWVEGYLVEQAPETVKDFVMQRRRWFSGLVRVILYAETKLWIRIPLAVSTGLWAVSWIGMLYTYVNLFTGFRTNAAIGLLGDFSFSVFLLSYVVGLYVNLRDRPTLPLANRVWLYTRQVLLLPVFTLIEAAGVLYALVKPERGFHVIQK